MDTVSAPEPAARTRASCGAALLALLLILGCGAAFAQDAADAPPESPEVALLPPPALDQLLAPVALYPDALLGQVLMASTYPLEVIEAYRWVNEPGNAALKGADLETALAAQDWDPSVKSLVPFPDVLKVMNDKLGWMQQLGNAFLSQEQDVMDSVQRLRNQAAAAGNLQSNEQQRVITEQRTIIIQPARTEVVYVPVYDPLVIYGPWLWPAYPPYFFTPFPRYGIHVGMYTWFSFGIVSLYWGWNDFDWHHHHIRIHRDHYNRIRPHHGRPPYGHDTWRHDPHHRRGVAYVDRNLNDRFRPNPTGSPGTRVDHRGYVPQVADAGKPVTPRPTGNVPQKPATPRPAKAPDKPGDDARPGPRTPPPTVTSPPLKSRDAKGGVAPDKPGRDPRPGPRTQPGVSAPPVQTREPVARPDTAKPATRVPPAFEGYSSRDAVRAATERGRSSRQSESSREAPGARPDRPERGTPRNESKRPR